MQVIFFLSQITYSQPYHCCRLYHCYRLCLCLINFCNDFLVTLSIFYPHVCQMCWYAGGYWKPWLLEIRGSASEYKSRLTDWGVGEDCQWNCRSRLNNRSRRRLGQHSGLIIGRPGLFLMRGGLFRGVTKWLVVNRCYFNFVTRDKMQ